MHTWLDIERASAPRPASRGPRGLVDVVLPGPLTFFAIARQEALLSAVLLESVDDVVLDLSGVTSVSRDGLVMLDYLLTWLTRAGRRLVVIGTHPELLAWREERGIELHASRERARAAA
jgi:anti-anti-sigma regulatory factor